MDEEQNIEAIEAEAKQLGWVPKEDFKGNEDKWVDAETYVERGRELMPLLRATNNRLKQDLLTRDQKIGNLESRLELATTAIARLDKQWSQEAANAVERAKADLKEQLKAAREDNDIDAEETVREKLGELDEKAKLAEKERKENREKLEAAKGTPDPKAELSPDLARWESENEWFGKDKKKTKDIIRVAEDLRDEGATEIGYEFMQKCLDVYEDKTSTPTPIDKVEGGNARGNSRSGSKTFASLPKEAREACAEFTDTLVGEGKRYKTVQEWQKAYTESFYEGS